MGMWNDLFTALALLFVLEGMLPFISPDNAKKIYLAVSQMDEDVLRGTGITLMLIGVLLLYFID